MADRTPHLPRMFLASMVAAALGWGALAAQDSLSFGAATVAAFEDPEVAREALERAQATADFARQRAERFSAEAEKATAEADRLANESAALAAQIQQSEADILAARAQLALVADRRKALDARLAERQQPLVRLTGAIQNMARRPVVLSAFQPGSLKDTVYVRAVLETTLPEIRARTAGLRSEVEQGRALEREAAQRLAELEDGEMQLRAQRTRLAALTAQQQEASRSNSAMARREAQRALALAEEARDLDDLVSEFDRAGSLRTELAALAGPLMRPERPGAARVAAGAVQQPSPRATEAPAPFQLPVQGRTIAGFGEANEAGLRNQGLTIASAGGAQIVAPAAGRVAFAGPYSGFGRIVIIEHGNGWTSLVTGLAELDVETGTLVIGGAPIGLAPRQEPAITYELRQDGNPINPLNLL